jgi:DNA-binding response OmpR family regulator
MGTTCEPSIHTVLVVEDQEDTACLLRFVLEREGFAVFHVFDGKHARHVITTTAPPDLIFLDIMLSSSTGLQLLRIIKMTPEWQQIPVILLTVDARSETMIAAANLGATEYVLKPFAPERVMKSVHQFLPRTGIHHGGKSGNAHVAHRSQMT